MAGTIRLKPKTSPETNLCQNLWDTKKAKGLATAIKNKENIQMKHSIQKVTSYRNLLNLNFKK